MAFRRYKLTIAYDGTDFHGWQKQIPPGTAPLRTVQGVITDVLQRLMGHPVNLVGASRTDAGVHAQGQVAHFDAESRVPVERMAQAITGRLPLDVEVLHAEEVSPTFDAIADAVSKEYRYALHTSKHRPLGARHQVYHCWRSLDLDQMNDAAARLVGTHNVEGFSAAGHGRSCTVRTIYACHVERVNQQVHIRVQGNGFLYNMVRIIAGTLVEVGRGRFTPDVIDRILESADRRLAGPTLPPQGLCLQWIRHINDTPRSPEEHSPQIASSDLKPPAISVIRKTVIHDDIPKPGREADSGKMPVDPFGRSGS